MPQLSALQLYLRKHPHYVSKFVKEICKIWWWRLLGQPIVVLTTESGGLGDYFWFRSYYSVIREHYSPETCRIIVIGMCQWNPVVYDLDTETQLNHFDIFRFLESPDNPLKIESSFFKLFKADVYVDFRTRHLKYMVKANKCYLGEGVVKSKQYYEEANNSLIGQWFSLPAGFKHTPPLLPIIDEYRRRKIEAPFVVFVERGNTQGRLSDEQTTCIVNQIQSHGYNIFFNGDYEHLVTVLKKQRLSNLIEYIIDGYAYPLKEYPTIVSQCRYIVTVNTLPYHIAIQLRKPCVVLSVNEYETIKLDAANQAILFNAELQESFRNNTIGEYQKKSTASLQDIDNRRIIEAIDRINNQLC